MKTFDELNATNSTIVNFKNIELRTTQDPYLDNNAYRAHAVDAFSNEYIVTWEIINHDTTDESEACDWDNPVLVRPLGK